MSERGLFNPGDKIAWLMPMDVYEGLVVMQCGKTVELKVVIGPNDEVHPVSEFRDAKYLSLVRRLRNITPPTNSDTA